MLALFDLDGTLIDPREGIVRSLRFAVEDASGTSPHEDDLLPYLTATTTLHAFVANLVGPEPRVIKRAIESYKRRYEEVGVLETVLYSGAREALNYLRDNGHYLEVVTPKPLPWATRILKEYDLHRFFERVTAPDVDDDEYEKAALIQAALVSRERQAGSTVMIGDRVEDVIGARQNGVKAICVGWGYGLPSELTASQPDRIVQSWDELIDYLGLAT
jgi:phosphoglycolate phosphatase